MIKQQKGFTLAETLITLTILGVVAAITVPSLINKYIESSNRTKVKKVMAAYEKALNQMIIENDVKSDIGQAINRAGCTIATEYFKKIQGSGCYFQTADKVWWDISDIEHPLISLTEEITAANSADIKAKAGSLDDDKTSFVMVGTIDNGVVRINDKGGVAAADEDYVDKLYAFINNEQSGVGGGSGQGDTPRCTTEDDENYTCTGSTLTWKKKTLTEDAAAAASYTDNKMCIWDGTICTKYTDNTSRVSAGGIFVSEVTLTQDDLNNSCIGSRWSSCNKNDYWNAYRKKCEQNRAHLATAAEIKALYAMHNSPLDSSSYYWVAEANSDETDVFGFDPYDEDVYYGFEPNGNDLKAVCVGN